MKSLAEEQFFALFLFSHGVLLVVTLQCQSPQYITLGQQGIIDCPFPSQFATIAWSDSANETATPIIKIQSQGSASPVVSGDGYDSGEYNMSSNGSLIILSPTINADRTFRVLLVYQNVSFTSANVVVKTIVRPSQSVPAVSSCRTDDHCFVSSKETDILNCTYTGARPALNLTWYTQINNENENLNTFSATFSDGTYTMMSTSTLDLSDFNKTPLNVFTCEASGPALGFQKVKRSVFVYDTETIGTSINETKEVEVNDTLTISCTKKQSPTAFIWSFKKQSSSRVIVKSSNSEPDIIDSLNDTFQVSRDGTLHFMHVNYQLEGIFTCISLEAGESSFNSERVVVIAKTGGGSGFPVIVIIIIVLIILIVVLCCVAYWARKHMSRKSEREYDKISKDPPEEIQEEPRDGEEVINMPEYDKTKSADEHEEKTSHHSSTNEQEQPNNEVTEAEVVIADPNEELPKEEDCPADESEDPANPDTPEEEQGASESGTAIGAALINWRLKFDHEDKLVDSIEELAKGDHIVFPGWAFHPRCHGIVVDTNIEKNEVRLVRFTYKKGVVEEWKKWKPPIYKVLKYFIGDKTLGNNIYDPDAVIERARKMLNNINLTYNIGSNNCKTFARWCKTDATPPGYGYDD